MSRLHYKSVLLSLMLMLSPYSHAEQIASPLEEIKQARVLIEKIQGNYAQQNRHDQQNVYLGNQQIFMSTFAAKLAANLNELLGLLRDFEKIKSENMPTDLQWLAVSDNQMPAKPPVNVGDEAANIAICRGLFLGSYLQNQGLYPGQITNGGCRISYGGYAFIVTKFDVLTGSNRQLKWIPVKEIEKQIQSESNQQKTLSPTPIVNNVAMAPLHEVSYPMKNDGFQASLNAIQINGARPLSGGYEGNNPVFICRAKQNNIQIIGKMVFFDAGGNHEIQHACDIGVNDKEIVIMSTYDVLFWKG